jgi:hypothetical protein
MPPKSSIFGSWTPRLAIRRNVSRSSLRQTRLLLKLGSLRLLSQLEFV